MKSYYSFFLHWHFPAPTLPVPYGSIGFSAIAFLLAETAAESVCYKRHRKTVILHVSVCVWVSV